MIYRWSNTEVLFTWRALCARTRVVWPNQGWEQIEYHCPACASITPVMVGIVACLGCGNPLPIIQVR